MPTRMAQVVKVGLISYKSVDSNPIDWCEDLVGGVIDNPSQKFSKRFWGSFLVLVGFWHLLLPKLVFTKKKS